MKTPPNWETLGNIRNWRDVGHMYVYSVPAPRFTFFFEKNKKKKNTLTSQF